VGVNAGDTVTEEIVPFREAQAPASIVTVSISDIKNRNFILRIWKPPFRGISRRTIRWPFQYSKREDARLL
jgi:hypothetical protein